MRGKRRQPSKSQTTWDSLLWSSYISGAHSVSEWRSEAMGLFKAAHLLLPYIEKGFAISPNNKLARLRTIYLMLVGMAFEDLGKALLIQMKSPIVKDGAFMLTVSRQHSMDSLA